MKIIRTLAILASGAICILALNHFIVFIRQERKIYKEMTAKGYHEIMRFSDETKRISCEWVNSSTIEQCGAERR